MINSQIKISDYTSGTVDMEMAISRALLSPCLSAYTTKESGNTPVYGLQW